MNTYIVSSLLKSEGKVRGVIVQRLAPAAGGGWETVEVQEPDLAGLGRLVTEHRVFVASWAGEGPDAVLGSPVRIVGTRIVSVDKDGVENDDLLRLGQFSD